jgi:hypothetical protein
VIQLQLPAVQGRTASGWLAAVGMIRILADEWPQMAALWEQDGLTLTDGPATPGAAADVVLARTIHALAPGQLLPGLDQQWPPEGREWLVPLTYDAPQWTGPAGETWQAAMVNQVGQLHPMLRPHAQQTLRRMVGKAVAALTADPGLLRAALVGYGRTRSYTAGLWISRHAGQAGDPSTASPGRDWLALMALPWMPARVSHEGLTVRLYNHQPRHGAVGWTWTGVGYRGAAGEGETLVVSSRPMMRWRLWSQPIPASRIPYLLQHYGAVSPQALYLADGPEYAAYWRAQDGPTDPPEVLPVPRNVLAAIQLMDREHSERTGVDPAARRAHLSGMRRRLQGSPDQ